MRTTRVCVAAASDRARVELQVGALAPRLISRGPATATVALSAAEMLLLGGDQVQVQVEVGAGCVLAIEDVGATVAHRADGNPSTWSVEVRLGTGSTLLWRGLPLILAADSKLTRNTTIDMGADSRAVVRESVVLGRHAEPGGRLDSRFSARDDLGPVLEEHLVVDGAHPEPGVLADCRVMDSVIALGFRPTTGPADLTLAEPGAIARFLGDQAHFSPLEGVWDGWAAEARQRTRVNPESH